MKPRIIFPLLLLAIVITVIIVVLGYPFKVKLFPLLVCLTAAGLLITDILMEVQGKVKQRTAADPEEEASLEITRSGYLKVVTWTVALLILVYLLGLVVGLALFAFLYLKLNGERWIATILWTVAVATMIYAGFGLGFNMPLYKGLLFGLV